MGDQFIVLCQSGKFNEAKELYKNHKINIHANDDDAFRLSCYFGHLNVAKWLYSLGGVNIHVADDDSFRFSCFNGHLNVAQWLYSLGGVNIHANGDFALKFGCCYSRIEIVEWLLSIDKFNNKLIDECLPRQLHEYAFRHGYLPIERMLITYAQYKSKIKEQIKDISKAENISIFEIDDLVNIITAFV